MPRYYSQHGEDFLLWQLFRDQEAPGYFVEVGALDGTRFSNTYSFEREGWSGICIEAHPDYITLLKKNRPNSVCVWAAANDHDGEVTLYANRRGSLSTLDPSLEDKFRREYSLYFTGFNPIQVPGRTLNTILAEANAPAPIDLISIDIEGAEMLALQGFDLVRYRPRVLVIEAIGSDFEQRLDEHLLKQGYHRALAFGGSVFYCRSLDDAIILGNASTEGCTLIHTPHPLDQKNLKYNTRLSLWRFRAKMGRLGARLRSLLSRLKKAMLQGFLLLKNLVFRAITIY
jgi:FkbM family methyltransferase